MTGPGWDDLTRVVRETQQAIEKVGSTLHNHKDHIVKLQGRVRQLEEDVRRLKGEQL